MRTHFVYNTRSTFPDVTLARSQQIVIVVAVDVMTMTATRTLPQLLLNGLRYAGVSPNVSILFENYFIVTRLTTATNE